MIYNKGDGEAAKSASTDMHSNEFSVLHSVDSFCA